ncbi:MAG: hypothetical protein KAX19_12275 [Candidatus Brocadiae bacterium]|nr:hypothetical protein [Candidatus Brocadiia bacterium]
MRTPRRTPSGLGRIRLALGAAALLAALAAVGCGRRSMTNAQAGIPDRSPAALTERQQAVCDSVDAMRAFRREYFNSRLENAAPDYGPARHALADALARLRPGPGRPSDPEFEQATQALELALTAMDEVIPAMWLNDAHRLERGWALFDSATASLVEVLECRRLSH